LYIREKFIAAAVLAVISSFMTIITPKLSQMLVDEVLVGVAAPNGEVVRKPELLFPLITAMCATVFTIGILSMTVSALAENASQGALYRIRQEVYANIQKQGPEFFNAYRTGDLMTRFTGDLDMLRHVIAWVPKMLLRSLVMFVAVCIYLFSVNAKFTLILLVVTPAIIIASKIYFTRIKHYYVDLRAKLSNLNTCAQENISGNKVIKAFAREKYEIEKFDVKNEEYRQSNLAAALYWLKFFPVIETLAQTMTVITVLFGGLFMIWGEITYGDYLAFSMLTWAFTEPMKDLGVWINDIQRAFASTSKVMEIYYASAKITDNPNAYKTEHITKGIEFKNVGLKYGKDYILRNISFEIKNGETVAVMGATGSGKTTVANLITRLVDASEGEVLVDGVNVKDWSLYDLRSKIGIATQDVFLFSDTVEGNIAYGNLDMPLDEIKHYAEISAAQFIDDMPEGYDTIIGERGVGLSGGQRQRIALARALAVKPDILILDDTTSAVDMETEKHIQQQLKKLDFKCTKLIIAQRISSVKNADKIIILDNKQIVEMGTHAELLKLGGYYREIYDIQSGNISLDEKGAED